MEPLRRAQLYREVNDRIHELLVSVEPDLPGEFLCECGQECGRHVELLPAAYLLIRSGGGAVRSPECARPALPRFRRRARPATGVPALS